MVALLAPLPSTLKLHTRFPQTIQTMTSIEFIIDYSLDNIGMTNSLFELNLIISDLNYISKTLPKLNSTKQVT